MQREPLQFFCLSVWFSEWGEILVLFGLRRSHFVSRFVLVERFRVQFVAFDLEKVAGGALEPGGSALQTGGRSRPSGTRGPQCVAGPAKSRPLLHGVPMAKSVIGQMSMMAGFVRCRTYQPLLFCALRFASSRRCSS